MAQDQNNFKSEIDKIRKAFKEFSKLSKAQTKSWERQVKNERKHHKTQMKEVKKLHTEKMRHIRIESRSKERLYRRENRVKERERRLKDRSRRKDRRERQRALEDLKRTNREAKRGGLGGKIMRAGAFAAGGAMGFLVGGMMRRYQMYKQRQMSYGDAIGLGPGSIENIVGKSGGVGVGLGFNAMQRAKLIRPMARATGTRDPTEMMQAMRGFGMSEDEVGAVFGTIRRSGSRFGKSKAGQNEFVRLMAAGVASGIERGRLPEFFQGVTHLLEQQQQMVAGQVNISGVAAMAGAFGRSGVPAFQGERGAKILAKMQQGLLQPKGPQNQAFALQAMGFGVPGGGVDYYTAEKRREQGLTPENFRRIMKENRRQFGSKQDAALMLRQFSGIGLAQAEELIKFSERGDTKGFEERLQQVRDEQKEAPTLQKEAGKMMKEAATDLARFAHRFDRLSTLDKPLRDFIEKMEDLSSDVFEALAKAVIRLADVIDKRFKLPDKPISGKTVREAKEGMARIDRKLEKTTNPREREKLLQQKEALQGKITGATKSRDVSVWGSGTANYGGYGPLFTDEAGMTRGDPKERKEGVRIYLRKVAMRVLGNLGISNVTKDMRSKINGIVESAVAKFIPLATKLNDDVLARHELAKEVSMKVQQAFGGKNKNKKGAPPTGPKTGALIDPFQSGSKGMMDQMAAAASSLASVAGGNFQHLVKVQFEPPAGQSKDLGPVQQESRADSNGVS